MKEKHIGKFAEKQRRILELYSRFVRRGGVLVYSTCSLLPRENKEVVEMFLRDHPEFSGDALQDVYERFKISVPGLGRDAWYVSLDPSGAGVDGFFIARMRRS
jgi:16S rRNA (cytosine967-C5)-methyltransferase